MRHIGPSVALLLVLASAGSLSAQKTSPSEIHPDFVSPPVKPVLTKPASEAPMVLEPTGASRPVNPRRTYPRPGAETVPTTAPVPKIDALLAIQQGAIESLRTLIPSLNFNGQGFTDVNPADPDGAIGPLHYVQMVNAIDGTRVVIYDKVTGSVVSGPFLLQTLGSGGACAEGSGDPIALYDRLAQRWILSEFASTEAHLCVYVSLTSSPTGSYFRYDFPTPNFPDYPKYSVWPNAYYVTTNEDVPAIYALDRTKMLAGLAATSQRFTPTSLAGFPFQAMTPGDFDGTIAPPVGSPAYFARHRDDEVHNAGSNDVTKDFIEIWQVSPDFVTLANAALSGPTNIPVTSFDSDLCGLVSFNCFAQPDTGRTLDPLREVIMNRMQYRNFGTHASLVGNFTVDVNGADRGGIRWFELRKTGAGAWTLFQEGTYSPDATNRWMGSIAMDNGGNMALAYSVSSGSVAPGLRYTGRHVGDTAGTMGVAESVIVNGSVANGSNRWGDYHAMTIDPTDDCTFWFTGMYSPATNWGTRIMNMKFDSCVPVVPPAITINDVSITEGNSGTKDATFTVSLSPASAGTVSVDYATANGTATATVGSNTSFSNSSSITIADNAAASLYPSTINVPAIGTVLKVTATITGFGHTWPGDVDVLLVGPAGQKVMLMSDAGSGGDVSNLTLTFDDAAGNLSTSTIVSGTYHPTNLENETSDTFPGPAPGTPYGTALSAFNGVNPVGTWSLYVRDDANEDVGSITGGWSLTFTVPGAAGDYTATSGTVTFNAGETSKPVVVSLNGDAAIEPNETFFVNLTNPAGATISDSQGLGTILNDDGATFTDNPLVAGTTLIKAIHVNELRPRIDAIRIAKGLGAFSWGAALVAGTSVVTVQHVNDLRTALGQAYTAALMTPPTYTDPVLVAGTTKVKAVHITEVRSAIVAIE
jgi:subtilisin-like proprotein convertase family protein